MERCNCDLLGCWCVAKLRKCMVGAWLVAELGQRLDDIKNSDSILLQFPSRFQHTHNPCKEQRHQDGGLQYKRPFAGRCPQWQILFQPKIFPLLFETLHTMYPDWPQSDADLVPLPRCDGPKLKPFDFQGAQRIEFLEYVGEGLHAHVFKVRIRGQIYALKLVCPTLDGWPLDWPDLGQDVT